VKKAETKGEKPEIEDEKKKQTAGELFKHSQQAVLNQEQGRRPHAHQKSKPSGNNCGSNTITRKVI
jgi:hypothetical protein